jgi:hypothetical protein
MFDWAIKVLMNLGVPMKDARWMAALKLTSRALTFRGTPKTLYFKTFPGQQ